MRKWAAVAVVAAWVAGCDMRDPATKKKEEEARRKAEQAENLKKVRVATPDEPDHLLVKADPSAVVTVQRPSVVLVKVARDGTIESQKFTFDGAMVKVEKGGAQASSGCCSEGEAPEVRAMAGQMKMLTATSKLAEGESCDEPVMIDGDYKAPWFKVRKVLEIMSNMNMTRVLFATKTEQKDLQGVLAKLPLGWKAMDPLPAGAKRVDVAANGAALVLTVDGKTYADVDAAVAAIRESGAKEVGIHPADAKVPLWAVVKGVELANKVSPAGPVRFLLAD
ncbi:MAG: hypothetical protein HYY18_16590 [Planctomycetes bacterium]|nr:hypothetical protein [Planctomycetota bacterium]